MLDLCICTVWIALVRDIKNKRKREILKTKRGKSFLSHTCEGSFSDKRTAT